VGLCAELAPVATESEGIARALRPVRRSRLYEEVVECLRELIDVRGLEPGDCREHARAPGGVGDLGFLTGFGAARGAQPSGARWEEASGSA
jgi:hypothetical protein